jgi:uncharacterized protein DUF899
MSQLDHEAPPRPGTAPAIVDRITWQRARDALLAREKAHTREGDAIAAARRRLPMTEVPNVELVGEHGPTRCREYGSVLRGPSSLSSRSTDRRAN